MRHRNQEPAMRETISAILSELGRMLENVPASTTNRFVEMILRAPRLFVTGQGRSGLMVKAFAQRLMQMGIETHASEEITTPAIARGDLLVVCSGTGETPINILRARIAKRVGAQVVVVTARSRSSLGRLARLRIQLGARVGTKASWHDTRSIQPIRSLFEQALLIYLDAVVLRVMQRRRVKVGRMARRHANLD
jgi:6-phospho-3-hexuloisomerase